MSGSAAAAALVEFRKLDFSSVRGNKMKKRSESARRQRTGEVAVVVEGDGGRQWRHGGAVLQILSFSIHFHLPAASETARDGIHHLLAMKGIYVAVQNAVLIGRTFKRFHFFFFFYNIGERFLIRKTTSSPM